MSRHHRLVYNSKLDSPYINDTWVKPDRLKNPYQLNNVAPSTGWAPLFPNPRSNMTEKTGDVRYLVFDIESISDGALISQIKYPGDDLTPEAAVDRYRQERMEKYGAEFIPHTYHLPVSIVVAKIGADFRLLDLVALDEPTFRPHVMTENFWRGWQSYHQPTLVTFNGRGYDVPVLELAAFRFGIPIPAWFNLSAKAYEQCRNRFNQSAHLDLQDVLTNFGATRFAGGLHLVANLLGKPGKMNIAGHMVQDLYQEGQVQRIADYCRCDVLDTYFVFLRTAVMMGKLDLQQEQALVDETRVWLQQRDDSDIYGEYLDSWGEWMNPLAASRRFDWQRRD